MKKINKNINARPNSLLYKRKPYIKALDKLLVAQSWYAKASTLYSSKSVKEALDIIYNGKCAFCEQKPIGSPAQVEHYRPKDGVKFTTHTGYYWLAYEWSNLLLACGNCNAAKGTNFPIANVQARVINPVFVNGRMDQKSNLINNFPLVKESPILINPEITDPAKHLFFTPDGELSYLTLEGDVSKNIYDLNRDELYVNGRKKLRDEIQSRLSTRLIRYINSERSASCVIKDLMDVIIENILTPILSNDSFSEYLKQMLLNFEDFFIIGNVRASILLRHAFLRVIRML